MVREGRHAWLLMAAGDSRGHGGNEGYDDQIDAYYSWDSNVPNARNLAEGDPIALWDKKRVLGVSVIETIESWPGTKQLNRCPGCGSTRIALRTTKQPQYRCAKRGCHREFDVPRIEVIEVTQYRARYDAGWSALESRINAEEIKTLSVHATDINAMRPIHWEALQVSLVEHHSDLALRRLASRLPAPSMGHGDGLVVTIPGGFSETVVRVRRGQSEFRQHILQRYGNVCAFTGAAPLRALEAGHLYRYAKLGEHHPHGGLMLRRDIHRLFDDGALAIDPSRLKVDVSEDLATYPQYARLQGSELQVRLLDTQVEWLAQHWAEHRESPRAAGSR
ncbi:HNH endonuclease [Demequina sp.]|uniref:HNH endonuclease n=1 Tax=Demequina sp. TaxID=2050685 RepID=UPI003A8B1A2F